MSEPPQGEEAGGGRGRGTVSPGPRGDGKAWTRAEGGNGRSPSRSGPVALRVRADAGQLEMLRAIAETIMLTADFTIDVVIDVRVALDQVATTLIAAAVPGVALECEFHFDEERVRIRVTSVIGAGGGLIEHSFGWHFVEALTDSIIVDSANFDTVRRGYPVTVEFTRKRGEDQPAEPSSKR
ncbi:anti-sigma factor [Nocardia tengchongensis]|uniref:anti-sigma factor n=1 Tax=Nocardia tengchongensis TaxID=2055889 RepID=UPI0036D19FBA